MKIKTKIKAGGIATSPLGVKRKGR